MRGFLHALYESDNTSSIDLDFLIFSLYDITKFLSIFIAFIFRQFQAISASKKILISNKYILLQFHLFPYSLMYIFRDVKLY